ncbi:unnamed protein product [Rotaria sp. Silwood1]|nr:unnamed protein product [Rotaria sp. Silwood1]CAF4965127.1 unnamed protein product [Rotaria sp. Silwood1]
MAMEVWQFVFFQILQSQITLVCLQLINAERQNEIINTRLIRAVVEQRFEEEIRRVESYLHPSTLAPLMKNLERVLIHEQLEAIYTQAKALLHDENYSDFACLFKLVGRVPNAIVQLKKFLKTIFIQKAWGNFINNNPITEAANNARKSAHFSTRACSKPPDNEYQQIPSTTTAGASYANVVKLMPYNTNSNEIISRKLDAILTKVEEESKATRQSLINFEQEIQDRYDEVKQQMEVLEQNVITIEKKFEDLSERTCNLIKNICTALLGPQASQGKKWKSYWQEQIKALDDVQLSLSKSDQ